MGEYIYIYIYGKTRIFRISMDKSNFKVGFRVREVSQRLDPEITLQMAFRRARGDFSRSQSGTGIIVYIALLFYISQTLDPKPSFQENLTFKETLIFHSSRKMRSALVYRLVSISFFLQEGTPSYILKSFGTLHLRPFGGGAFFSDIYIYIYIYSLY